MPSPSADARTQAYSSDSPELLAMVDCVFEYVRMRWLPTMMVPPDVDFRPLRHPAQLASEVMSTTVISACHSYFHINLGLPLRYRPMRFSKSQARTVGLDMSRHTSLTAY